MNKEAATPETVITRPARQKGRCESSKNLEALLRESQKGGVEPGDSALFYSLLQARLRILIRQEVARTRGHLNKDETEDVLQEILVSVWRVDLGRYQAQKGSLLGFLRTRVRWQLHNAIRANARRHERRLRSQSAQVFSQRSDAQASVEAKEEGLAVRRALKKVLDPKDPVAAYAIDAHDLQGVPLIQVARALRVHPSQVTRARKRGLAYLRYVLNARHAARR